MFGFRLKASLALGLACFNFFCW